VLDVTHGLLVLLVEETGVPTEKRRQLSQVIGKLYHIKQLQL